WPHSLCWCRGSQFSDSGDRGKEMPFKEHRGGGKSRIDFAHMPKVWDSTWTEQDIVPLTDDVEHWAHIARHLSSPGRILEAGCGLARWVSFLESKGFDSFGVDFSPLAIRRSHQVWPGLKLVRGDLRSLPFKEGFFQGIVSFGAIEHDEEGPERALRDLYRV